MVRRPALARIARSLFASWGSKLSRLSRRGKDRERRADELTYSLCNLA